MRHVAIALGLTAMLMTSTGVAQPRRTTAASIPSQYHGRWATTTAGCADHTIASTAVTIDRRGWAGWEEGAHVTSELRSPRGGHRFRVRNFAGAEEWTGTLALHVARRRLTMAHTSRGQTVTHRYVRCR